MTQKIRLGNGEEVFACCGGFSFHVGSWHKEMEEEQAAKRRRRDEYRDEQAKLRGDLVGEVLTAIEVGDGYSLTLKFENGSTLRAELTGGEMDGHFDPPANRSMFVEVKARR